MTGVVVVPTKRGQTVAGGQFTLVVSELSVQPGAINQHGKQGAVSGLSVRSTL